MRNNTTTTLLLLPLLITSLSLPIPCSSSAHPAYDGARSCDVSDDLRPVRREEYGGGRIIDITHFYREDMPYGESMQDGLGQFLWLPMSMKNGSRYNGSVMKLPGHAGTHVDAPGHMFQHYFEAGFDIDTLDLDVLNGNLSSLPSACVILGKF